MKPYPHLKGIAISYTCNQTGQRLSGWTTSYEPDWHNSELIVHVQCKACGLRHALFIPIENDVPFTRSCS